MKKVIKKIAGLPVGVIGTMVGLATLSNVYATIGFQSVRYVTMILGIFVLIVALIKLTAYKEIFLQEYRDVVPASLYATFTMLLMIIGSFVHGFQDGIGRGLWLIAVVLHVTHILIFTYRNVIKGIKLDTFVPSWFVTYAGVLVAVVLGVPKGMPGILTALMYYAFGMYALLFPLMIYRVIKHPIPSQFEMTKVILLAPTSLLLVGYLNAFAPINQPLLFAIYAILFATIIYVSCQLPSFLGKPFNVGHAALTFPTAIALVATFRMADYLTANGFEAAGQWVGHFFGIQLWVTTAIIAYVGYGFFKMFTDSFKQQNS
ncbi:MAG: TDT family transporter [Turicibacter sp.]|nr:TDT family transporter [Turicibacter sp.]